MLLFDLEVINCIDIRFCVRYCVASRTNKNQIIFGAAATSGEMSNMMSFQHPRGVLEKNFARDDKGSTKAATPTRFLC